MLVFCAGEGDADGFGLCGHGAGEGAVVGHAVGPSLGWMSASAYGLGSRGLRQDA